MSDYPMQDPYAQGPPPTGPRASAKYEERPRSPPRDSRDAGSRAYVPPARPSNAPVATPSNVLGVFGLSIRTREEDLEAEFSRSGRVEKVVIVYDQRSGRSRGFGFVTLGSVPDAEKAIEDLNGMDLHGRRLRVDFSATTRPHEPTPGEYRGPRRIEEDMRGGRGPASYGSSRYEGGGDRYGGGGGGSYGGRSDRYDDRRGGGGGGYSRDERYSSSRGGERSYGSSSYGDRYGSGGGAGGSDRYSSSRRDRDDYRSSRDDRDRDYGREPRRRDSRSPDAAGGARERSPVRRERTPPRDEVKEDY